jgi:Chaperone for flagella basal body P-ring formation
MHKTAPLTSRMSARAFALAFCLAGLAHADEVVIQTHGARIHLGDILPDAAPALADVDLGPAPAPGASRYLAKADIAERLRDAGIAASTLPLPTGVRVTTPVRRRSPEELRGWMEPAIRAALPAGLELEHVEVRETMDLPSDVTLGEIALPNFASRTGRQLGTVSIELLWGQRLLTRTTVHVQVQANADWLEQALPRGAAVTVAVVRGGMKVSAIAETLAPARVGQAVQVRIVSTKKTLTAVLVSPHEAEVRL